MDPPKRNELMSIEVCLEIIKDDHSRIAMGSNVDFSGNERSRSSYSSFQMAIV